MADREPIVRDDGRTIDTGRWLAPVRSAISRNITSTASDDGSGGSQQPVGERWLAPVRSAISRVGDRAWSDVPWVNDAPFNWSGFGGGSGGSVVDPGTGVSATGQRYYIGDDPFSVLADLYLRAFGSDSRGEPQPTQYSVVPTEVGGGGSGNTVLILLVLAGAGFAIYWFYFRKKQGGE